MSNPQIIIQYQPLLERIAKRIVGSAEDAKDVVQDTFVKWLSADHGSIKNHKAYLIRSVKNNALNFSQNLTRKKEQLSEDLDLFKRVDDWYHESEWSQVEWEDEVQAALFILQSKLEPMERAVFLMREVFNFDYDTIQESMQKQKDNLRQIVSRAKKKLAAEKAKPMLNFKIQAPESMRKFFDSLDFGSLEELKANLSQKALEAGK
jgi:RNA polymerase sigma-70 factor (ECF subfamily)